MTSLILFGGTFDPPHRGHLMCALAVQRQLNADHFYFIPCKIPAIKPQAHASEHERLQMLQLLLASYPQFQIDTQELTRKGPSYTVETLQYIRHTWGKTASVNFLLGLDSFLQLTDWHRWETLLSLANLVIMMRPGYENIAQQPLTDLLAHHAVDSVNQLLTMPYGGIYRVDAGYYQVSSTWIRQQIQSDHLNQVKPCLSEEVFLYVEQNEIYKNK